MQQPDVVCLKSAEPARQNQTNLEFSKTSCQMRRLRASRAGTHGEKAVWVSGVAYSSGHVRVDAILRHAPNSFGYEVLFLIPEADIEVRPYHGRHPI
jgi:hypothetical protein